MGNHSELGNGESINSQMKNGTSLNLHENKSNDTIYHNQYLDCPNLTSEGNMLSKITSLIKCCIIKSKKTSNEISDEMCNLVDHIYSKAFPSFLFRWW